MLNVKSITITNYLSVGNVVMKPSNGLYKIVGANLDNSEEEGSNGSGKTSLLTALHQGLFNKSLRNSKALIGDFNSTSTGKPYRITTVLDISGVEHTIDNDRAMGTITVTAGGKVISPKGIKTQLAFVSNLLGLDFELFSALTFVSQTTLNNIIDTSSADNLVYKFIDMETINHFETSLKRRLTEYNTLLSSSMAGKTSTERLLNTLKQQETVDIALLQQIKANAQEALLSWKDGTTHTKVIILESKLATLEAEQRINTPHLTEAVTKISIYKDQLNQLKKGVCPVCASDTTTASTTVKDKLCEAEEAQDKANTILNKLAHGVTVVTKELTKYKTEYNEVEARLNEELRTAASRLLIAEENRKNTEKLRKNVEELEEQVLQYDNDIAEYNEYVVFIKSALQIIKSGALTKQYIQSFVILLNKNLRKYSTLVDVPVSVSAVEAKGKLDFSFKNGNNTQDFMNFSSGERTRLALIVLFSVIDTLEQLTGICINYLVLDELLSVVDQQGLSVLKNLLDTYRESKAVYVVLHHNEIEDDYFNKIIKVTKKEGITSGTEYNTNRL